MIVRISGEGQYELDDAGVRRLDEFDSELTQALNDSQEQRFHQVLVNTIAFVKEQGKPLHAAKVVPSDVIIPPEDVTLSEAKNFFNDEGMMEPLPA